MEKLILYPDPYPNLSRNLINRLWPISLDIMLIVKDWACVLITLHSSSTSYFRSGKFMSFPEVFLLYALRDVIILPSRYKQ